MKINELLETATAGATSSGNIATVTSPNVAYSKKIKQPKKKNGTAVNALDMKGTSIFGGAGIKRESIEENKKGVRAPKRVTKPRNPVAKNAMAAVGGGAAGAHKDKKKAAKQGDVKHKAAAYENALDQALAQSLKVMEGHGRYWCSTDKKWKERKGPKQKRS